MASFILFDGPFFLSPPKKGGRGTACITAFLHVQVQPFFSTVSPLHVPWRMFAEKYISTQKNAAFLCSPQVIVIPPPPRRGSQLNQGWRFIWTISYPFKINGRRWFAAGLFRLFGIRKKLRWSGLLSLSFSPRHWLLLAGPPGSACQCWISGRAIVQSWISIGAILSVTVVFGGGELFRGLFRF